MKDLRRRSLAVACALVLAAAPFASAQEGLGEATWAGNVPAGTLDGNQVADFEQLFFGEAQYDIFTTNGAVYAFGGAPWHGNIPDGALAPGEVVIDGSIFFGAGDGYIMTTNRGHTYSFNAPWCGGLDGDALAPGDEIVEFQLFFFESDCGYYLFSALGQVFAFENPNCGSIENIAGRVVDVQFDLFGPGQCGYSIVTDVGAVYSFGQAHWFGSLDPAILGDQQVIQLEPTFSDRGSVVGHILWTAQGNSYALGEAEYPGSAAMGPGEEVIRVFQVPGGHLLFTNLGRVIPLGEADADGSLTPEMLGTQQVVDAEVTFSGGQFLVTDLGNVYAFDDGAGGFADAG